ncbi:MAG: hypothetical protein AUJ07_10875 [Crenarchaeota archaeon 13_1_40CM_3_53_5]|nr:MAG: hypothetical protein AUJ07_10875 [Crenarchaeota archaeon 13_1_40CM_3_53_5]
MTTKRQENRAGPISVDTEAIMRRWRTAEITAERLFRFLEKHRTQMGHDGFHTFYLNHAEVVSCDECNLEIAKTRKPIPGEISLLVVEIWNRMIREAKVELKARRHAVQSSKS